LAGGATLTVHLPAPPHDGQVIEAVTLLAKASGTQARHAPLAIGAAEQPGRPSKRRKTSGPGARGDPLSGGLVDAAASRLLMVFPKSGHEGARADVRRNVQRLACLLGDAAVVFSDWPGSCAAIAVKAQNAFEDILGYRRIVRRLPKTWVEHHVYETKKKSAGAEGCAVIEGKEKLFGWFLERGAAAARCLEVCSQCMDEGRAVPSMMDPEEHEEYDGVCGLHTTCGCATVIFADGEDYCGHCNP